MVTKQEVPQPVAGGGPTGGKGADPGNVDTGRRVVGVSAAHIHRAWADAHESGGLACQIGGHSFDPSNCLLDIDDDLDLATYAVSEIQVVAARAHVHTPSTWPPKLDESEPRVLMACGWPWALTVNRDHEVDHFFLHFFSVRTDVTDRRLIVETDTSTSVAWSPMSPPPGTNIGGMSGGSVYQVHARGLRVLTLVGVISEYSKRDEYLLATPIR